MCSCFPSVTQKFLPKYSLPGSVEYQNPITFLTVREEGMSRDYILFSNSYGLNRSVMQSEVRAFMLTNGLISSNKLNCVVQEAAPVNSSKRRNPVALEIDWKFYYVNALCRF